MRGRTKVATGGGLGVIVLAVVVVTLMGGDPMALLGQLSTGVAPGGAHPVDAAPRPNTAEEEERIAFVETVLADTEDVWNELFAEMGRQYPEPTLVRFRDEVRSACGIQSKAVGPFYCPADSHVYLDLSFFDELARRHRAAGDFAQVYVIAHEIGHHVQNVLGDSDRVRAQMRGASEAERNRLSVRQELHADFLSGVFAHHLDRTKGVLERGDLGEALNAASRIGDDVLQREARGYVRPDGFTHGTAEQRRRWFELGFDTGDLALARQIYTLPYDEL